MVEIVVCPVIHHHGLRIRSVPDIQIERKQRQTRFLSRPMRKIMPSYLTLVIRQSVSIRFGFGKQ
jgi:hypothetical protein